MQLLALDGNSIVNRAYYGVRPLTTRDGFYTNAIYGFLNIMQKLLDDIKPDALCVTFDRKAPTFRHLAYAEYKGTRKPMPEELAMQIPVLREILEVMHIPFYEMDGWEADDLLGTISRRCESAGWDCVIATGDKDSLQLITDHTIVKLVTSRMGQTNWENMTCAAFVEKYGFEPIHMIDLKGLMGDTSDNIPGVKGVGEKTAMNLVQTYGSIADLYANFETSDLKGALRTKLENGRDQAQLSYDLATIRCDAPIEFIPEQNMRREPDQARLYELFLKLEFTKLIERYHLSESKNQTVEFSQTLDEQIISTEAEWNAFFGELNMKERAAVILLPEQTGVCLQADQLQVLVIEENFAGDFRSVLCDVFSGKLNLIVHRAKELIHDLLRAGLPSEGIVFDTALAAYLLSPTDSGFDLPKLGITYFNQEFGAENSYMEPEAFAPLADQTESVAVLRSHTALIYQLEDVLKQRIHEQNMDALFFDLELPLCKVLAEMELAGVHVDRNALENFGVMLEKNISKTQAQIYELAGGPFNINSTKQLGEILFEKLDLPVIKKTKRGYSTNAEVLEKLRQYHPIVDLIFDYRKYTKLKSTYVDGLKKEISMEDGRIHTLFQNTVTATGRLSSAEPNLQNIPVRTSLGAEMRKMFLAPAGMVLVDADYSQIELRLLAHISDDKAMQEGFRNQADIHAITASQVFGVPLDQVTKQMRSDAKAVNFGIVYGISEFSLAKDIGVTIPEATAYMRRYFEKYSGVRRYQKEIVERAREDGYVTTMFGRCRWLPELKSSNHNLRQFGERVALNMPIQGTAADIIKKAMLAVSDRLKREGLRGRLVLQVHDELIVECPEEEGAKIAQLLEEEMEQVVSLSVPLVAEAHIGKSWADAH